MNKFYIPPKTQEKNCLLAMPSDSKAIPNYHCESPIFQQLVTILESIIAHRIRLV